MWSSNWNILKKEKEEAKPFGSSFLINFAFRGSMGKAFPAAFAPAMLAAEGRGGIAGLAGFFNTKVINKSQSYTKIIIVNQHYKMSAITTTYHVNSNTQYEHIYSNKVPTSNFRYKFSSMK